MCNQQQCITILLRTLAYYVALLDASSVERMLRRPYCLSAEEIAARRKDMQKIGSSYQCVQPRFQVCLHTTSAADDEGAHDKLTPEPLALAGHNPGLWSTGRKGTRKRNYTRDSAIGFWPSQELKAMTTISHGAEYLSGESPTVLHNYNI